MRERLTFDGVGLYLGDVVEVGQDVSFHLPLMSAQVIASKYLNDEGETEAFTNTEWAKIGTPAYVSVGQLKYGNVSAGQVKYGNL